MIDFCWFIIDFALLMMVSIFFLLSHDQAPGYTNLCSLTAPLEIKQ